MKRIFLFIILLIPVIIFSQDAKEIIRKSHDKAMGKTSKGISRMTIIRPDWKREIEMKNWSRGFDYYLIYITKPAREKGQVFLKREKEMWNYIPSINRMIKIPSSMMGQSWMGSDFTNDDLMKESSIIEDYNHKLLGEEKIEGYDCYKVEMIPKEEAAVVWGKVIMWVSKKEYMQLKAEYYDEFGDLVSVRIGTDIKKLDGRLLPSKLIMIPKDKEGHKTILETISIDFDVKLNDKIFSQQNMKRVR